MKKLKDLKKGDKFYIILGKERADIPKLIEGEVITNSKINTASYLIKYYSQGDRIKESRYAFYERMESSWYHELRDEKFYTDKDGAREEYIQELDKRINELKPKVRVLSELARIRDKI